jgi:hypothetical protein
LGCGKAADEGTYNLPGDPVGSFKRLAFGSVVVAAVLAGCSDGGPGSLAPTTPRFKPAGALTEMGACISMAELEALAHQVFGSGSPNVNSVLGKLDNLRKKVAAGDVAGAQEQATNIVNFVRDKAAEGRLPGTQQQITQFISGVLCYAGLSPDTYLILPSDEPQVRIASDDASGVALEGNTVDVPTLLTITTLDPNGPSPLDTKLDQYPTYVAITVTSQITKPAIVAVCPTAAMSNEVRARARLGHQKATGFEITPAADAGFLPCTVNTASSVPGWLRGLASLFTPKPLYAAFFGGGIGGSVTEFSPFGAVDPTVSFSSGGIGGSATEFGVGSTGPVADASPRTGTRMSRPRAGTAGVRPLRGTTAFTTAGEDCSDMSATVGTAVECRPLVTVTTPNGTILQNVPVTWTVVMGGGSIAQNALPSRTCGDFGSTVNSTTDEQGRSSVCWTLGTEGGENRVTATPGVGGDAPAGVSFVPAEVLFSATGVKITPTATATGGTFVFDNEAHAGSGSCTHGLTPALSYSSGGAPVSVGTYALTVTCGEGSTVYNTVTASAEIVITAAVPTVAVSCPESVVFDGSAQTPCTAQVTAPGLSLSPEPSYENNTDVGTATASVDLPASGNYAAASGSSTFLITPAASITTVSCPATALSYDGQAHTPCTAVATGVGGLSVELSVTYADNVNAGTATATAAFAAAGNWLGSTGSATFTIQPAATVTTVTCSAATYTGAAHETCTASVTGPGGLDQSLTPTYSGNVDAGTAAATASYAGSANYQASTGSGSFVIAPAPTSVAVSCPTSIPYDATNRTPCTASVSGPLLSAALPVTYVPSPVFNAGSYTASAVYSGGGNYVGSVGAAQFAVTKLPLTATAGSAAINFGDPVPTLPCSVSGLLAADAGSVTCTTSVPPITAAGTYTTTPVVSPASPVNYAVTGVTGTLTVAAYVQVNCFEPPIYNVMPDTKSAQRKGSNLPVKCTLTRPDGSPVTTATGDLVVLDRGPDGNGAPVVVFSGTNVFKYSRGGNYSYGLDTSPAGFVAGNAYYVTATWNDGSTTTGWFRIK